VASYYRPPSGDASAQLNALEKSLQHISKKVKNNPNHTVILGGDFNLGDILWETETVDPSSQKKTACDKLIQMFRDHYLSHATRCHTRRPSSGSILYQ